LSRKSSACGRVPKALTYYVIPAGPTYGLRVRVWVSCGVPIPVPARPAGKTHAGYPYPIPMLITTAHPHLCHRPLCLTLPPRLHLAHIDSTQCGQGYVFSLCLLGLTAHMFPQVPSCARPSTGAHPRPRAMPTCHAPNVCHLPNTQRPSSTQHPLCAVRGQPQPQSGCGGGPSPVQLSVFPGCWTGL
jgi:hypothetical protein